jgi:hypothetical protein
MATRCHAAKSEALQISRLFLPTADNYAEDSTYLIKDWESFRYKPAYFLAVLFYEGKNNLVR